MTRSVAAAMAVQAALAAVVGLVVLDMRAHDRVEGLGGVNVWGYRGTELGRKRPHDLRIGVFGGDLAFGWGVKPTETLANYVGRLVSLEINRAGQQSRPVTAVVAGARGMRPAEFAGWIRRFSDLQLDIICLVPDEPGHRLSAGRYLPDRRSLVFASTGYSPILPLVLREKAELMHSALLGAAARVLDASDLQTSRVSDVQQDPADAMRTAVRAALSAASIGAVLVLPPRWSDAAAPPLEDPRFRIVRLDADPEMSHPELRLDGYHFSAGGHSRAAETVAPAVLDLIHARDGGPR